jgi:beta-glucosidase
MMDGYTKFVAGYSSLLKAGMTMHDLLHDFKRIEYHKAYLAALLRAIR